MSSYKYQIVGHNASGFDNCIVLKTLPKSYTNVKKMKISRGLIKLIFRVVSVWDDDREIPEYVEFFSSKCRIVGALEGIQKKLQLTTTINKKRN